MNLRFFQKCSQQYYETVDAQTHFALMDAYEQQALALKDLSAMYHRLGYLKNEALKLSAFSPLTDQNRQDLELRSKGYSTVQRNITEELTKKANLHRRSTIPVIVRFPELTELVDDHLAIQANGVVLKRHLSEHLFQ